MAPSAITMGNEGTHPMRGSSPPPRAWPAPASVHDAVLDVRDLRGVDHLDRREGGRADVLEQSLTPPEDDRNEVQVELVEHPRGEVLLHGAGAAGDGDVALAGRCPRPVESRADPGR